MLSNVPLILGIGIQVAVYVEKVALREYPPTLHTDCAMLGVRTMRHICTNVVNSWWLVMVVVLHFHLHYLSAGIE